MFGQYKETLTIFNRLRGSDALTKQDIWYKTIITGAAWSTQLESGVSGTTLSVGNKQLVLIPNNPAYLPYKEWCKPGKQLGNFTLSLNDYIIRGIVEEEVNAQTITKTLAKYEPNVCSIRGIEEAINHDIVYVRFKVVGV